MSGDAPDLRALQHEASELLERLRALVDTGEVGLGPVLDKEGASRYVGISVRKLEEFQARGEIPCFRIGRLVRFARRDLDEWLLTQRSAG